MAYNVRNPPQFEAMLAGGWSRLQAIEKFHWLVLGARCKEPHSNCARLQKYIKLRYASYAPNQLQRSGVCSISILSGWIRDGLIIKHLLRGCRLLGFSVFSGMGGGEKRVACVRLEKVR